MKKTIFAVLIAVAAFWGIPAWAWVECYDPLYGGGTVRYDNIRTIPTDTTTLNNGTYLVPPGTTTFNDRITINGGVSLILCSGATLNANSGITVAGANSLTIWAEVSSYTIPGTSVTTHGSGMINAKTPASGTYRQAAAIGGLDDGSTGDIFIFGGVINAHGSWGAGIGRGNCARGNVGSVTICDGYVNASGSKGSAGIGSGAYADSCPVTISGGYVVATGCVYDESGQATPGIGTGRPRTDGSQPLSNGKITITGGTVIAQAGTPPSGGTAAQAIGVNSADAAHNGTSHLVLGKVRAYASSSAKTPVAVSARGNTCRSAWVKLEACTSHGDGNADSICDYCGEYFGPYPPVGAGGAYTISTVSDWNALATCVNAGVETCQGKTVRLAADVGPVSNLVGISGHPFMGTFDGGGHTLTVSLAGSASAVAPFASIDGATISNLNVAGTVTSTGNHAAGLVGACASTRPNVLRGCTVAVTVNGSDYAGGIVGHGGQSVLTIEDCVFSGAVNGFATFAGGLLGWCEALTLKIGNCLCLGTFEPVDGGKYHPIACKVASRTVSATVAGAYYLNTLVPTVPGVNPTLSNTNLIPGAEGAPVSATLVEGEWAEPVAAADGNTYYAWTPAPAGRLLARFSFDDAGNGGTNLLHAAVGSDAVVRATPATPVAGIGDIAAVADADILSGLAPGDGAVAITNGQHLAVPVPAALLSAHGRPYTVVMKIRVPDTAGWRSLLNMPAANDTDAMIYLNKNNRNVYLKQFSKASGSGIAASDGFVPVDQWSTLSFAFGENGTEVRLDGRVVLSADGALAGSYADCVASGGYILVGADDDGDDSLFYLSEFRIYEGAVADEVNLLPGSGTSADPYVLSSTADWNTFASNVLSGVDSAACYRLGAEISASTAVGTAEHPFCGTFDGAGHTLVMDMDHESDTYCAPFSAIAGATIRRLKVAGTVSGGNHSSGLVGCVTGGTNLVEDCEVSASITASGSGAYAGGFVGHGGSATITLRGCVFSGSCGVGSVIGNFVGWDDAATITLVDCFDASTSQHPIGRGEGTVSVGNTYYIADKEFSGDHLWAEGKRGKRARTVTAGEDVTMIGFGAPAATYATTGIAAYGAGLAYDGTFYAGQNDVVSLTLSSAVPPFGQALDGYSTSAGSISGKGNAWTLTMADADAVVSAVPRALWAGSGTADDPYLIVDVAGWNDFAAVMDGGADTTGKHFLLAADVTVSVPVGSLQNPFQGVFDGGGHMLTAALNDSMYFLAPFYALGGATIRNLEVSGTVRGGLLSGGLVGHLVRGTNTVENCSVSATIAAYSTSATHCGGVIGYCGSATITLRGCVFSGSFSGGSVIGTIVGWDDVATVTLIDCFDASTSQHPIGRGEGTVSVSNTYYVAGKEFSGNRLWAEDKRGKHARTVTAGDCVAIGFGAPAAVYATADITAYGAGLAYGDTFYAGEGDVVPMTLSTSTLPFGQVPDGYSASAGSISGNGNDWTLTMPDTNVVVSAVARALWAGSGTADDPYRIVDDTGWNNLVAVMDGGADTTGKHFLLAENVTASAPVGSSEHPFKGVFDGGGRTLTANLSGTDAYLAPFAALDGATIRNMVVDGTVSGGVHCAGLAGLLAGGTNRIENCVVETSIRDAIYCGGIVGVDGDFGLGVGSATHTTLAGCVFDGNFPTNCEVACTLFLAGCDAVVDCLDLSDSAWPTCAGDGRAIVSNTYYTATNKVDYLAAGIPGTGVTAKASKPASIGEVCTDYGFVKAYAFGLEYGGMYYVVEGVVVAENGTAVPCEWLERYYPGRSGSFATIVNSVAENGRKVWACYIADLDPTDPDSDFVAGIDVSGGKVRVYIEKGESPNRCYRVLGRKTLDGDQFDVTNFAADLSDTLFRFFHIEVSLHP